MKIKIKTVDRDFIILCVLSVLFFIFQIWDIYSGYYSAMGDEYSFYLYGKNIATGENNTFLRQLFSQDGVYGFIPVMSGVYQGLVMKILGVNVLGWKSAQIIVVVASIFPLFYLVRRLWDKLTAYITVILLMSSHYIWGYIKSGYCNLEAIFPTTCSLYFFDKALHLKSKIHAILAGVMAGVGFMTFYSSRVTLFVVFFVGFFATLKHKSFGLIAWVLIGFSIIYVPFVLVNGDRVYNAMFNESFISSNEHRRISRTEMIPRNAYINARAFFFNTHEGPYVSGSLVDPITGVLAILGLLIVAVGALHYRNHLVLAWLFLGFLATGVFSKFSYPAISRLNYLIPVVVLLGAIATTTITKRLNIYFRFFIISTLLICILGLNLQRFYITTPRRNSASRETAAILAYQRMCLDKKTLILDLEPGPVLVHILDAYMLKNVDSYRIASGGSIPQGYDCYIVSEVSHINDKITDTMKKIKYNKHTMAPIPNGIRSLVYTGQK